MFVSFFSFFKIQTKTLMMFDFGFRFRFRGSSSMAKKQKSIRDAYFAKSRDTDSSTSDNNIFVHSPRALWKEQ